MIRKDYFAAIIGSGKARDLIVAVGVAGNDINLVIKGEHPIPVRSHINLARRVLKCNFAADGRVDTGIVPLGSFIAVT